MIESGMLELSANRVVEVDVLLDEIVQIEEQAPHLCGARFAEIKKQEGGDWYKVCTDFCKKIGKEPWSKQHIYRCINYSLFLTNVVVTPGLLPPLEKHVRPLTTLPAPDQQRIWKEISPNGKQPEPPVIKKAREKYDVQQAQLKTKKDKPTKLVFNWTSEMVDWAKWTWNPVFGCKHGCEYCYARDFAKRQGRNFAKPEIMMHKLMCPKNTQIPKDKENETGVHNVFVCSMADLFGDWVEDEWIQMVLNAVNDNPQWNYIFLTKNPKRLVNYDWPAHAWVGTTIDCQKRVAPAEEAFQNVNAKVRFVSIEPFNEPIKFNHLERFNWVIIGGRSKSSGMPAFQPESKWVERIIYQARKANCKIYFKPNLEYGPKEYPTP